MEQIITMQPPTLPLRLPGLLYYLFAREGRPYRALGWVYIVLFVLFAATNSKFYFLAPAYPMLFAASAFGSIVGVVLPWVVPDRFKEFCVICIAGGAAGSVLWLFAAPGASIAVAVSAGVLLGVIGHLFG